MYTLRFLVLPGLVLIAGIATVMLLAGGSGPAQAAGNTIAVVDGGGRYNSVERGADGLPIISYVHGGNEDLGVAHCGNITCSSGNILTTVDSGYQTGVAPFVTIGSDGLPVISYSDNISVTLKVAHCGNAACTAGNTLTTIDSAPGGSSVAIGSDGLPLIGYGGGGPKVAHCGNVDCTSGNTLTTVDSGFGGSVAIGSDGLPLVAYNGGGVVKVAHCGNVDCTSGNTLTTVDSGFNYSVQVVVGSDSLPFISYWNGSQLNVAHCGNATCSAGNTLALVSTSAGLGHSLMVGLDGLPLMSYFDTSNADLKVAHCGNATCTTGNTLTTVAGIEPCCGSVGTSVAVGSDGLPVISYFDISDGLLKVAHCADSACTGTKPTPTPTRTPTFTPTPCPPGKVPAGIGCGTPTPTPTPTRTRPPTPTLGTPPTQVPTNTPTGPPPPTPTAKPLSTGVLSGVSDIWVPGGVYPNPDKGRNLFHCISYTAHEAQGGAPTIERIKTAATCFDDINTSGIIGDPNSALNGIYPPDEGPDLQPGPPPPPPFGTGGPAKGAGTYDETTAKSTTTTCFPNVGGSLGPNIIWVVEVQQAVAQLASTGKQQGSLTIYGNQSNSQCRGLSPAGPTFLNSVLNIKIHPADKDNPVCAPNCDRVPWRAALAASQDPAGDGNTDYDGDGCTDAQELDKTGAFKCGNDPWNPYDSGATDYSGVWYILATARPADSCRGGTWDGQGDVPQLYNCAGQPDGTFVPGAYYHCYSYITQGGKGPKALIADVLCYIDFGPNTAMFPIAGVAPGPGTPLSVNPEQCGNSATACPGDGKAGAAPPGKTGSSAANPILFADIPSRKSEVKGPGSQTHLIGVADNVKNAIRLWGCFEDTDNRSPLGWVYVQVTLDKHTWQGKVAIWSFQTQADCQNGTPQGTKGGFPPRQVLPVEAVKQSASPSYDTDQDGCPDRNELGDDPATGGLRDPANPWDYFNPLNNDINRTGDITAVVQHYGHDADPPGDPLYGKKYDRSGSIPGSNKWNLQPPDGIIRTADITAAVNSYGHDCGTGINKTPIPTRTPRPVPTKSPPPPTKTP